MSFKLKVLRYLEQMLKFYTIMEQCLDKLIKIEGTAKIQSHTCIKVSQGIIITQIKSNIKVYIKDDNGTMVVTWNSTKTKAFTMKVSNYHH